MRRTLSAGKPLGWLLQMMIRQSVIARRHLQMDYLDLLLTIHFCEQPSFFRPTDIMVSTVVRRAKLRDDLLNEISLECRLRRLRCLIDEGDLGRGWAAERIDRRLRFLPIGNTEFPQRNCNPLSCNISFQRRLAAEAIATPIAFH